MGTIADIYANGYKIGSIDNLYRTYYFDIPNVAINRDRTGLQRLRIDIQSTVRYTYARAANYTGDVVEDYFWDNMWITPSWIQ